MTSCSVCAKPRQRPAYGRADSYCHCGVAAAPTHCATCGLALEPTPYSSDRSRCKCRAVAPSSAASAATSAGVASGSNALQIASAVLTLSYVSTAARDEAVERVQAMLAELPQLLASVGAKGKRGGR